MWLSMWSEVQIVCIWPSWCHCIPKPHHLLPHLNSDWFYLSGTSLPRLSWKRGPLNGCSSSSSPLNWHRFCFVLWLPFSVFLCTLYVFVHVYLFIVSLFVTSPVAWKDLCPKELIVFYVGYYTLLTYLFVQVVKLQAAIKYGQEDFVSAKVCDINSAILFCFCAVWSFAF